jgi:sortase (surface protein transpeptidase)
MFKPVDHDDPPRPSGGGGRHSADNPRTDAPRVDPPRVETPRPETTRPETPKVETPRVETPKVETAWPTATPAEVTRPDTPRVEPTWPQATPPETAKVELPQAEAPNVEPRKAEPPKPEALSPLASRLETTRIDPPRAEATRRAEPPRNDETQYIPRVEDFGAAPQGGARPNTPAPGFPKPNGLFAGPGPNGPGRPGPNGPGPGPGPGFGAPRPHGGPPGMDDRTEIMNFGGPEWGFPPDGLLADPADRPPAVVKTGGRTIAHTLGEVLITAGMVVLLFVVYELYITNIFSAQKQANATTALDKEWDTVTTGPQRTDHYDLSDGAGIAKLYIPSLGQDYHFTVIEGTNADDLAIGPGHYVGTTLPGQPGNFAVAGHRVGEGAPFNDLDLVQSCDAIVIETQSDWYIYRLLPMVSEQADWASAKGKTAQCSGIDGEGKVAPLGGLYSQTPGQEIVLPTEGDVVAPIPHHVGAKVSTGQEAALLTLTTCHPKFSDKQRMILHAVLTKDYKKDAAHPNQSPPELKETS